MKIRFLQPVSLKVTETKNIEGKLEIIDFEETMRVNKMVHVAQIFPGKDIAHINFQTEENGNIKLYQDADITTLTFHQGSPDFLSPEPVTTTLPPITKKCGGCPGR